MVILGGGRFLMSEVPLYNIAYRKVSWTIHVWVIDKIRREEEEVLQEHVHLIGRGF